MNSKENILIFIIVPADGLALLFNIQVQSHLWLNHFIVAVGEHI